MTPNDASPEEVDRFLNTTHFSGYQAVPLPHGRSVPGRDRGRTADIVFASDLKNKTVLDVGTYYGFFPNEAIRRGASKAVGLEIEAERYEIAQKIAELNGAKYEIAGTGLESFNPSHRFDIVLALNLLHHVLDPVEFVTRLSAVCTDTLIIEFRQPHDPLCIESVLSKGKPPRPGHRAAARVRSLLLSLVGNGLPLMAVGNRPYHRIHFFSPEAFYNLFVVHLEKFRRIEFVPSPGAGRRIIAFCEVAGSEDRVR